MTDQISGERREGGVEGWGEGGVEGWRDGGRGGWREGEWNLMKRCTKRHSFTFRHTVQLLLQQEDLLTHTALSSGF